MTAEVRAVTAGDLADRGLAYQNLDAYEKTKGWTDQSFAWVIPTAGDMIHWDVVDAWNMIDMPMNQARTGQLRAKNMEVGDAYNYLFRLCTDEDFCLSQYQHPEYVALIQGTRFVMTTEQDNVLPPNTVTGLMAAIYTCPDCGKEITQLDEWLCPEGHHGYDAVSGLYFTKGLPPRPMVYGNPANGPDDFRPQSISAAIKSGETIECNGVGMGACIWRKDLFRKVSYPWFETIQTDNMTGSGGGTQDLTFARKAKKEANARFGVCTGVKVGHVQYRTGKQY